MKKLILAVSLHTLRAPVFAESATSGVDGYVADFDIKTDEIKVWTAFTVADVCLLNQRALKNAAEAELRRLGFKVAGEDSLTLVFLAISGTEFSSKNSREQNGCSIMLSVSLFEMVDTTLVLPSGRGSTKMEGIWSTGGLFTTSKLDMTEQMKTVVRKHVKELWVEIVRPLEIMRPQD